MNFCVFSQHASSVDLLFFDSESDAAPSSVITLDPSRHRTDHYWHVFVRAVRSGQLYGYRVCGPSNPGEGHRFDATKLLLDPYGKCVAGLQNYLRPTASSPGNNFATALKSVVVDFEDYDWEGDRPLHHPFRSTAIYEMHVRGFTKHPSSSLPSNLRGTYGGVTQKIPYLSQLGITAVELMPVFHFDPHDTPTGLPNYWGYSPVSFFAPHFDYCSQPSALACLNEFRDMVKALHRADIEVILDVVYNHTAEGDGSGPILCFRGFENSAYYLLEEDRTRYRDFTGTGNTLNTNHPIVRRMILDSLRHWVSKMHVDGFRFDLAAILSRDSNGIPIHESPIIADINSDPVLAGTKNHRRSLGCSGFISSRQLWRRQMERMERTFPGRHPQLCERRPVPGSKSAKPHIGKSAICTQEQNALPMPVSIS